jgi:hypothetical protein
MVSGEEHGGAKKELTCAVASPFALMASITGLLDAYKRSMKGVKKGW